MLGSRGRHPAEVFGYPVWNQSEEAYDVRKRHWCPFQKQPCNKQSRLLEIPFGACSVESGGQVRAICPHRFLEKESQGELEKVFRKIALHYFGDVSNTIVFPEVGLKNVGNIDYVLVRHRPMKPEVEDFVAIEFQSDSTTSTGKLVQGVRDFVNGADVQKANYQFGMNTYDSIKRTITQLINKGIVYEKWGSKCYWVMQEYIYNNLVKRYSMKADGFNSKDASRFTLFNLVSVGDVMELQFSKFVSVTVEEIFQAMLNNPGLPDKDSFVEKLGEKLRLRLSVDYR